MPNDEAPSTIPTDASVHAPAEPPASPPSIDRLAPRLPESREARSGRLLMLVIRSVFMILLVSVTLLTVNSVRSTGEFTYSTMVGLIISMVAVGLLVLAVDALTPNKRLAGVVGIYLGVCLGLIGAVAFGALIDVIARAWEIQQSLGVYLPLAKSVVGLVFCYLSISVVLTTKDDFRLVIPYVEFSRTRRGVRPWLVDTSVLIDGRLPALAASGFVDAPIVVPQFVVEELQKLADSGDRGKRGRGRRGLDLLGRLRESPYADVSLQDFRVAGMGVDRMLVEAARSEGLRILTLDNNLEAVARIQGVTALNLNHLATTLRPALGPGDTANVQVTKRGEGERQGVGYLPDGTMIVIEDGQSRVGATVSVVVTNAVQTAAGRLLFAKIEGVAPATSESMADAATRQPRHTGGAPARDPRT
ncbi:MAG: PIN domain-containing protein [Phycisphaerales bacterium]|jgi:uncharacterized protein YacL